MTKIAITGAAGRMGRRIAARAIESEQFDLVAATESPGHEALGADVGVLAGAGTFGVKVAETLDEAPDVLIDFTTPDSTLGWLDLCGDRGIALVIGTTGLTESQTATVADAAAKVPIVHAGNMSVGVNLLIKLVALVAETLGAEFDIEIAETHHRFKKDAPSGTAIALARSICAATGREYGEAVALGRGGHQPRTPGEIGMHALRVGDTVGEHQVHFGSLGETITLSHSAHTRDIFADGALRAAQWLAGKPAGLYDMCDVLGL
ncbi:MAG: 4-hydroxy-tetrahydrodipicolinate reductase [Phycisphaerae bacterium]|nr:4-hydroxy-tetrahydrodipicolinate reductase [Phycisphaerae bacterium]